MKIKTLYFVLLTILLTACGMTNAFNTDTDKVATAAAEIADLDLPAGYNPEFTASLQGYTVVSFTPGDGHSHLYLIQSEKETAGEKLGQMLQELVPSSNDSSTRMTLIETRQATLRGQEVTLVLSEGVNSENQAYRQVMAAFQGKGGPALVVLSEPVTRWSQETMAAFIASIH